VSLCDPSTAGPSPYAIEEAAIERAVEKRKREFRAGRECARRALNGLGLADEPIPVLPNRGPGWPEAVVGAITHCRGFAGAVAAWRRDYEGVGLDAELVEPLRASLSRLICTDAEVRWMTDLEPPSGTDWVKVIFSAKEAVYKCIGPLVGRWVGFREVTLDIDPARRAFKVVAGDQRVPGVLDIDRIEGRYAVAGGLVISAALLAASTRVGR